MRYYINIGSNLGDRRLNISRAIAAVEKRYGYFELSKAVESEPWGFDSINSFLNVGMMFETDQEPIDVLHSLQEIESRISPDPHRNPDGSYADRKLDIDIMAIRGDGHDGMPGEPVEIDTEELKVPHPHLFDRPFFIGPLRELLDGEKEKAEN